MFLTITKVDVQLDCVDVLMVNPDLQIHPTRVVDQKRFSLLQHKAGCRGSSLIRFPTQLILLVDHSMKKMMKRASGRMGEPKVEGHYALWAVHPDDQLTIHLACKI